MNTAPSPRRTESFLRRATCPGMGPKPHGFVNVLAVQELAGQPGVIDRLRWRRRQLNSSVSAQRGGFADVDSLARRKAG